MLGAPQDGRNPPINASLRGCVDALPGSTAVADPLVAVADQLVELDALSPLDVAPTVAAASVSLSPVAGRKDFRDQLLERDATLPCDARTVPAGRHLAVGEGQQAEHAPVARTAAGAGVADRAALVRPEVAAPTASLSGLTGRTSAGSTGSRRFHGER